MQSQQLLALTLFTMCLVGLVVSKSPLEGQDGQVHAENNRTTRGLDFIVYKVVKQVMVHQSTRDRHSRILEVLGSHQDFGKLS